MTTRLLLVSLLLVSLSGCLLLGANTSVSSSATEFDYHSQIDLPEARAFYAFSAAQLMLAEGNEEGAIDELERALLTDTSAPAVLRLGLAELYLKGNAADKARYFAEEALRIDPRSVEACIFLGNLYAQGSDYQKAASYFRQALAIDPERESSQLHLALVLARGEEPAEAAAGLQGFLQRHPESVMAAATLARLYRETDEGARAEEVLQQLLKRRPDLEVAPLELGALYEERGDIERALAYYRQGREINSANLAVRHYLARLLINLQRLDEALHELHAIVELNPDDLEARRKIGLIHLELRQWDEAVAAFRTILESDPGLLQVRYYLGNALEGKGETEAALEAFAQIGASSDLYEDALLHRAMLLHQSRRTSDGIALLEGHLRGESQRPELFLYLAALYQEDNQPGMVLSVYDRGMERFPQNTELSYRKGLALELRGLRDAALEQMRAVLAVDANHAEAINFIAYNYAESGNHLEEALQLALKAVGLKREGHIVDTLGWVYYRLGRLREARVELEAAVKLLPEDAVVREHLGDVYRALRQFELAEKTYRRSLELVPDNPKLREKLDALPRR